MQRYTYDDGKSSKFWHVEQRGTALNVGWGKAGTAGQSQVKVFDSEAKAAAAKDKLVKEKTGKGYVAAGEASALGSAPASAPEAAAQAPATATKSARASATLGAKTKAGQQTQAAPGSDASAAQAASLASGYPASALQAPREAIEAWLAEQRAQPGLPERSHAAWLRFLQLQSSKPFDRSSNTVTPRQLAKLLACDEASLQSIDESMRETDIAQPYGNSYYFRDNKGEKATAALARCEARADEIAATLLALRQAMWAPLAGVEGAGDAEPAQRNASRFGQRLDLFAKGIHPWPMRGEHAYSPPNSQSLNVCWHLLRAARLKGINTHASDPALQPAIERLRTRMETEHTAQPEWESDLVMLSALLYVGVERGSDKPQLTFAYLVQAHGLAGLIRMLGEATQLCTNYASGGSRGLHRRLGTTKSPDGTWWSHKPMGDQLAIVRRWLLAASDADWQAAVNEALSLVPSLPVDERAWLALLFSDEPQVALAVVAAYPSPKWPQSAHWLLAALPPDAHSSPAWQAALPQLTAIQPDSHAYNLHDHAELLEPLLAKLGEQALPFLVTGAANAHVAHRLSLVNHPDAIAALARLGKDQHPRLKLAVARWPLAGAVGLARHCAQAKDPAVLTPLLAQAMAQLGPGLALLPAWLPPAALALVNDMLAKQAGPAEVAAEDELPPVLARVPWLQGKKRSGLKAMSLAPLALDEVESERPSLREWDRTRVANALATSKADAFALAQELRMNRYRNADAPAYVQVMADAIRQRDAAALVTAWQAGLAWLQQQPGSHHVSLNALAVLALPEELGLPLWNACAGSIDTHNAELALAHWGKQALPGHVRLVRASPSTELARVVGFGATELAPVAARAAFKLKTLRSLGQQWLLRWPEHALCGLIAPALGKPGEAKDVAAKALRFFAANGQYDLLMQVAARYGDAKVIAAVQATLDEDPLDLHPSKVGGLPEFWQPQMWTRPVLHNGKALGDAAMTVLGQMLMFPRGDGLYEGIAQVKAACTPDSLAGFAWDLFSAWLAADAPAKEGWAFTTLGILGDDETARRLTPMIRVWPGEAAHARAVTGLDVLAGIGSDLAMMQLNGIAQKLKFKGLQDKAREKIAAIAEARGLTTEELEDRLAPDLGLDERGTLVLDFGPRQFKVGFDEALKPWVRDYTDGKDGARLKDLPKPIKSDDAEKAKEATERYKLLKKDAKTIAAQQIQRLEVAMCQQRRWSEANFRDFIATHPLVRHIAQRLVWGVFAVTAQKTGGELEYPNWGGELLACFRLGEDGSLNTADDAAFTLPTAGEGQAIRIGLPHALQLRAQDAQAFAQVLADYELLQPFAQLGRDTHALSEGEQAGKLLTRWHGRKLPTGRILGLANQAWRRGDAQDGGGVWYFSKPLMGGRVIELSFEPGFSVGYLDEEPEQTLGELTLGSQPSWGATSGEHLLDWRELDAIQASELIRDMEALCAPQ